jgi:4a-hydroxytetrahydrobiopterin dehydratase
MSTPPIIEGWRHVERPRSLFRRFEFESYAKTRAFLDRLSTLSEDTGIFPDLGFGTTYVNVTVYFADELRATVVEADYARRAAIFAQECGGR